MACVVQWLYLPHFKTYQGHDDIFDVLIHKTTEFGCPIFHTTVRVFLYRFLE